MGAHRTVTLGAARVTDGRWGARRARVDECAAVARAEAVAAGLQRAGISYGPGDTGHLRERVLGRVHVLTWTSRPNRIWAHGRLYLQCPDCQQLVARLYLPTRDARFSCRTCLGLSYPSRQRNY
jgi:hypothetical protein